MALVASTALSLERSWLPLLLRTPTPVFGDGPSGRAAIYARQSITREGSASLDVQVEACREAAARLTLEVVAELVEAPSTSGYSNVAILPRLIDV